MYNVKTWTHNLRYIFNLSHFSLPKFPTVAHNCHGKKQKPRQNKTNSRQNQVNPRQNKVNSRQNQINKRMWSAVGQRCCPVMCGVLGIIGPFSTSFLLVCFPTFLIMFCSNCRSTVDQNGNFCTSCCEGKVLSI